jgi:exonuclease V gamma subunit
MEQSAALPQAELGRMLLAELDGSVEAFVEGLLESFPGIRRAGERAVDLEMAVAGSPVRVVGRVGAIVGDVLLQHRFAAIKRADMMRAWISHLALSAGANGDRRTLALVGRDLKPKRWAAVDAPEPLLQTLLAGYLAGREQPLPFFPTASETYARTWIGREADDDGTRHRAALAAARDTWEPSGSEGRGSRAIWEGNEDLDDPAIALCFGDGDPIGERPGEFARWSLAFWRPCLTAQEKARR